MGILQARILEWVAKLSSRGSYQTRDQTQVSSIAGESFTHWVTREAQEYWSGWPIPSPVDLPDPGIKPGSPALQVDCLPAELPMKPQIITSIINILRKNKMESLNTWLKSQRKLACLRGKRGFLLLSSTSFYAFCAEKARTRTPTYLKTE